MIAINGSGSAISRELMALLPLGEQMVVEQRLPAQDPLWAADRWVFAQGVLHGRTAADHTPESAAETFRANCLDVIAACDQVFDERELARVVVIGSESGFSGSYDSAYAAAKAGLHAYVETKRLKPRQQLVCVAPGIIADAGMTTRRPDKDALAARALEHPKRRFVTALEVAKLIRFLLYDDIGYLSGITIRMNGGQHTCR